jgi:hypothetical protein
VAVPEDRLRRPRWERYALAASLLLAVVAFLTDWLIHDVSQFWVDHPMIAGLVSGGVILPPLLILIERGLERHDEAIEQRITAREAERWRAPAVLALRALADDVLLARDRAWDSVKSTTRSTSLSQDNIEEALTRAADFDAKRREVETDIRESAPHGAYPEEVLEFERDFAASELRRQEAERFPKLARELVAAIKGLRGASASVLAIALYPPLANSIDELADAQRALQRAAQHSDRMNSDPQRVERAQRIAAALRVLDDVARRLDYRSVMLLMDDRDPAEPFEAYIQRIRREDPA